MPQPRPIRITVCRGCCCGSRRKHPKVDHDGHLQMLQEAVRRNGAVDLRVVDCLGHCDRSSIVIIQGLPDRRRPLWLRRMDLTDLVGELCDWIADGAHGMPGPLLMLQAFDPQVKGRVEACS